MMTQKEITFSSMQSDYPVAAAIALNTKAVRISKTAAI